MSLSRKLIHKLQIKVKDIEDEKRELFSAIEDFVNKASSDVVLASEGKEVSVERFRDLSCYLDYVLCSIVGMVSQIQKPHGTTSNLDVDVESMGLESSELKMAHWEHNENAHYSRVKYGLQQTEKESSEGLKRMKEETNSIDSLQVKISDLEIKTETNKCQITSLSHELSCLHGSYEGLLSRLINLESKVNNAGNQEKTYGSVIYDQRVSCNPSQVKSPVSFVIPPPTQNLRSTLPQQSSTPQLYFMSNTPQQPGIQIQQLPPKTQTAVSSAQYNQGNNVPMPNPTNFYTALGYPLYQHPSTPANLTYQPMYYNHGSTKLGTPQMTAPIRPALQKEHQVITKKEPESQYIFNEVYNKEHTEANEIFTKEHAEAQEEETKDISADPIKSHDLDFKLAPASSPGDKAVLNPASCPGDKAALNPASCPGDKAALNPASCTGDKAGLKQTTETEQPSPDQMDIEEPQSLHGIVNPTTVKVKEKLRYDRAKLLEFRFCSVAMSKPEGLPDSVIILDEPIFNARPLIRSTEPKFPEALFRVAPTRKTLDKEKKKKETVKTTENPGLEHN